MRRLLRPVSIALAALVLSSPAVGQTISQLAEVMGTQPGSQFGFSVAVSGNTAVVAAPSETVSCQVCGVAYVFTQTGGDWSNLTLVATLTQAGGAGYLGFGNAVAISGNTIVVSGSDGSTEQRIHFAEQSVDRRERFDPLISRFRVRLMVRNCVSEDSVVRRAFL